MLLSKLEEMDLKSQKPSPKAQESSVKPTTDGQDDSQASNKNQKSTNNQNGTQLPTSGEVVAETTANSQKNKQTESSQKLDGTQPEVKSSQDNEPDEF
jgi:hypothetical protein